MIQKFASNQHYQLILQTYYVLFLDYDLSNKANKKFLILDCIICKYGQFLCHFKVLFIDI